MYSSQDINKNGKRSCEVFYIEEGLGNTAHHQRIIILSETGRGVGWKGIILRKCLKSYYADEFVFGWRFFSLSCHLLQEWSFEYYECVYVKNLLNDSE